MKGHVLELGDPLGVWEADNSTGRNSTNYIFIEYEWNDDGAIGLIVLDSNMSYELSDDWRSSMKTAGNEHFISRESINHHMLRNHWKWRAK